jgi:RHS repeat-associated protein
MKDASKTSAPTWLAAGVLLLAMPAAHAARTVTYYLTDAQGSVIMTEDAQGNTTGVYDYRPYGAAQPGPAVPGPGYTGHVQDPDTGLVYMQQRYYASNGRFLSPDPMGPVPGNIYNFNRYAYANNNPMRFIDPTGRCAEHYSKEEGGGCKVEIQSGLKGKDLAAAQKAQKTLEGVLNKYDKAVNGLVDNSKVNIVNAQGKVVGSMTGSEIKAVWNGTKFTVTSNKDYGNGGAGGGTGGTWSGNAFSGHSGLNASAVSLYATAATWYKQPASVGTSTLVFHELGHETHFGMALTQEYPVTSTITADEWPREWGASSAGNAMAGAAGAPFNCAISGGCVP